LELIESLMKQNPRSGEIAAAVGWIYYRLGRLDDAERYLQAAASSGGVSLDILYIMAKLSADRGKLDQAKQLLQGALKGTGPFIFRQDARTWHDQLANIAGAVTPTNTTAPKSQ
jgi:tetratricopeptide (TPR) repeat protein